MAKSIINCKFCGNLLAKPVGGKAILFGKMHSTEDQLPQIPIKTIRKFPEKKTVKLLLDTMIIHQLINGKSINELTSVTSDDDIVLVVLDRILIETENMEKAEYQVFISGQQLVDKLEGIGTVEKIYVDYAKQHIVNAIDLFNSKKYVNDKGVPLSETDCILLENALLLDDVKLITQDKTLIDAIQKEKKIRAMFC